MSTTIYRYNNGLGLRTGFTDNTGYAYSVTPMSFTQGMATTSMAGTFSITPNGPNTYVNLQGAITANINLAINATYSQIFDKLDIMVQGGSITYSVVLSGDATEATSLTTSLVAGKYLRLSGQYNGTKFILGSIQGI